MSASKRRLNRPLGHGSLVLDNEGVSRAAADRTMYIRIKAAHADGRRVITSATVLAELLRGNARDAGIYRVLSRIVVEPVTRELGERAGKLIGSAGLTTQQAVDAIVAATAIAEAGPVLIATSDIPHLSSLVADHKHVSAVHVSKLG